MAVTVNCPGCRTSYPVTEDLLGKKIRCKKCQETFTAAAAKSAVAARAADDRITTRRPAKGGNGPLTTMTKTTPHGETATVAAGRWPNGRRRSPAATKAC